MYKILNNDTIRDYVDEVPEIRDLLLGPEESIAKLEINEIGDGNLNFVYIVTPEKPKHFPKIGTLEAIKGYSNNQET